LIHFSIAITKCLRLDNLLLLRGLCSSQFWRSMSMAQASAQRC
jgi:hypothetical protein